MKPKVIICIGTIIGVVCGVFMVMMFLLGIMHIITNSEKYLTCFVCGAIAVIPIAVCDIVVDRAKEKINPLNRKKQLEALEYAFQNAHGKKAEFIQEHGETMYNHFIENGYIHSPMIDNGTSWEITVLGKTTRKRHKTNK